MRDSLIPCDAGRVGRAALAAMALGSPGSEVRLPAWFGSDAERDASFLAARMRGEPLAAPGFFLSRQRGGRFTVVGVDVACSPHACGVRAGGVLTHVDGRPAVRANSQVLPLYAAAAGAVFRLGIEPGGWPLEVRLVLARGEVPSVVWWRLEDGVRVVRVRWFASSPDGRGDTATLVRRCGWTGPWWCW